MSTLSSSSSSTTTSDYVTFISTICGKLKDIKRTGWVRSGIPFPESDADHMHRCAMCAMLLFQEEADVKDTSKSDVVENVDNLDNVDNVDDDTSQSLQLLSFHPSKVDKNKLLKMALTHDLCESLAGDITPHCDITLLNTKEAREQTAMEEIRKLVGDPLGMELFALWREYEDQETCEAIYCKDIDKFEMVVQAFEYEEKHLSMKGDTSTTRLHVEEMLAVALDNTTSSTSTANLNENGSGVLEQPLRGFFASTSASIKTPLFRKMDLEVRHRREVLLNSRGWDVTDEERQQPRDMKMFQVL